MNLNIYNNSNGNNDPKNVPFKAYLLNKYEHLKVGSIFNNQPKSKTTKKPCFKATSNRR